MTDFDEEVQAAAHGEDAGASPSEGFLHGAEWVLHQIAGPGRCTHVQQEGEIGFVCGSTRNAIWHRLPRGEDIPQPNFRHEFRP